MQRLRRKFPVPFREGMQGLMSLFPQPNVFAGRHILNLDEVLPELQARYGSIANITLQYNEGLNLTEQVGSRSELGAAIRIRSALHAMDQSLCLHDGPLIVRSCLAPMERGRGAKGREEIAQPA